MHAGKQEQTQNPNFALGMQLSLAAKAHHILTSVQPTVATNLQRFTHLSKQSWPAKLQQFDVAKAVLRTRRPGGYFQDLNTMYVK